MSLTHLLLRRAWATVVFFLLLCLKRSGNNSAGIWPFNHLDFQKEALFPLFTVTLVAAAKRLLSVSSTGSSEPTHGLSGQVQEYHNQRRRSARPKRSRSRTPKPPLVIGKQVFDQLTLHFPHVTLDYRPIRNDVGLYQILWWIALGSWEQWEDFYLLVIGPVSLDRVSKCTDRQPFVCSSRHHQFFVKAFHSSFQDDHLLFFIVGNIWAHMIDLG